MHFGLLGEKLSHSYSPQIHKQLAEYSYELFEVSPEKLGDFLQSDKFSGINVTIPYKKAVIPYCSELSPIAKALGAVNTILRRSDGSLYGHNTDYYGFSCMLKQSGLSLARKKVLVLGSGGASATVNAVLKQAGAVPITISRFGENNYQNIHLHYDAEIIVNTTPVGMYPNTGISPISLSDFTHLKGVLDLIYNPARTKLILDAQQKGSVTVNGLWMLIAQAKESAELFSGVQISDQKIQDIYRKIQKETENIVLIGMPGCGKSTIGKRIAKQLNKKFIDIDACIVEKCGCSIPEIFEKFGEKGFRAIESEVLSQYGCTQGAVISTGGGCVTVPGNYASLRQNGIIVWLQRDIQALSTDGRPLSNSGSLQEMYTIREPLYTAFADFSVDNNGDPAVTVSKIISILDKESPE